MKPRKMERTWFVVLAFVVQGVSIASAQAPVQVWVRHYSISTSGITGGKSIGVDTNGNVFVCGSSWNGSSYGYATLAYSTAGTALWTNRYDAGTLDAHPSALAVARNGNVFVTGSTSTLSPIPPTRNTGYRFLTVAYSGSGAPLWTNSFFEGGDARPAAIAVGQSGTVIVSGKSSSIATTLAYSSAGVPLWTNHYQSAVGGSSSVASMALDDKDNVFVAGSAYGADGSSHYAVVAYSLAGIPLWTNQYIGPTNFGDFAAAVAVDSAGNVVVTGEAYNSSGLQDYLTVAYSGAGVPLWTRRYGTSYNSGGVAIAVDTNGNFFVAGQSLGAAFNLDYATVAYTAGGSAIWTNRYDGASHGTDSAVAAVVDRDGHVVVTGYSSTDSVNYDYLTIWYSAGGAPLWTNRYSGPGSGSDQASAIAADTRGNVFVTGTSWNGTNYEFATIKYAMVQPVPLLIRQVGNQIVLNWTNAAFGLQVAPSVSGVYTNVPGATSPYSTPITGGGQFFRLISN
jgi:hypothetical protein